MDDDVRQTECRHPRAGADRDGSRKPVHVASDHDEAGGDRGVERREQIVCLEAPDPPRVMGAMNRPQPVVPHAPMEKPGPRLHARADHDRDDGPDGREHRGAHEDTP